MVYNNPRDNPDIARPPQIDVIKVAASLALLRALSSYSWLSGALVGKDAKFSPDFLSGPGLAERITDPQKGFARTAVCQSIASFLTGTVVPHFEYSSWSPQPGFNASAPFGSPTLWNRLGFYVSRGTRLRGSSPQDNMLPPGMSLPPVVRFTEFVLPFWMLFLLFALLPFWNFMLPLLRGTHRLPGRCAKCGYDLRATPDRCPECGTIHRLPI